MQWDVLKPLHARVIQVGICRGSTGHARCGEAQWDVLMVVKVYLSAADAGTEHQQAGRAEAQKQERVDCAGSWCPHKPCTQVTLSAVGLSLQNMLPALWLPTHVFVTTA